MDKLKLPTLSDYMQEISLKFAEQVEQHPVLMKVNDALFDRTSKFFNTLLFLWLFAYIVPLGIQIIYSGGGVGLEHNSPEEKAFKAANERVCIGCNASCLTIIIIMHIIEMIVLAQYGFKRYFGEMKNIQR